MKISPAEIEELRLLSGWTIRGLADRYLKSPTTAARWTTGLTEPSLAIQKDMLRVLNLVRKRDKAAAGGKK